MTKSYFIKIRYQATTGVRDEMSYFITDTLRRAKEWATERAKTFPHGRVLECIDRDKLEEDL